MESPPNWVPTGVITHFRNLDQQNKDLHDFGVAQVDIEALRRCIYSTSLEKAWDAISSRSDKCDPEKLAKIIIRTSWLSRMIQHTPTTSEIAGYEKLSKKVRDLLGDFDDVIDPSAMGRLNPWLGEGPQDYLEDLAERLDDAASGCASVRQHIKKFTGKPKSKSGRQTYVIRLLYQNTLRLYDQPLHDVVAALAGEILGNPVDPETARSIYKIPRN